MKSDPNYPLLMFILLEKSMFYLPPILCWIKPLFQHEACNHGRFEIVQLLLDNGAYIDIPGCDHDTPLHDAIANNRIEVAEFLITKGASLDVR